MVNISNLTQDLAKLILHYGISNVQQWPTLSFDLQNQYRAWLLLWWYVGEVLKQTNHYKSYGSLRLHFIAPSNSDLDLWPPKETGFMVFVWKLALWLLSRRIDVTRPNDLDLWAPKWIGLFALPWEMYLQSYMGHSVGERLSKLRYVWNGFLYTFLCIYLDIFHM